jgi:hypothetical protein
MRALFATAASVPTGFPTDAVRVSTQRTRPGVVCAVMRVLAHIVAALCLAAPLAGSEAPLVGAASTHTGDTARQMKALVRAWSDRLNARDNDGLARLFALPAFVIQAPYAYRLATRAEIARWYAGLPCAGHVVSITVRGRYATAVFRLANRGSTPCDAPGTLAAARFEIAHGKIVSWEQVPVPKRKTPKPTVA